jgi:hypothetical protein
MAGVEQRGGQPQPEHPRQPNKTQPLQEIAADKLRAGGLYNIPVVFAGSLAIVLLAFLFN